jgi:hypothetical protein
VAVPIEVNWHGTDGIAVKQDALASECEDSVYQRVDRPQRLVAAHALLRRDVAERVILLLVVSSHARLAAPGAASYKIPEFFCGLLRRTP